VGRLAALGLAIAAVLWLPATVIAHPLGNFTINHYAGLRIERDRVLVDLVIDQAEIPTFQERLDLDLDGDATISDDEIDTGRKTECAALSSDLSLTADDAGLPLQLVSAGLSFPPGAGGLSTMRVVCQLSAPLPATLAADHAMRIAFEDRSFAARIGWREITVVGSGASLTPADGTTIRSASISDRLRSYPADRIATPLDDRSVAVDIVAGGPVLPPTVVNDATAVASVAASAPALRSDPVPAAAVPAAAVPGGVTGGEVPAIFRTADLTPLVLFLSVMTAVALGAGHAVTPGHGKTVMAAYLVGTRGTPAHAVGLGLSVSLSHTVGILVLAGIVVGASDVLPPDLVVRAAPIVAAVSIAVIGGWMLYGEWRRRRVAREHGHATTHEREHLHGRGHAHEHDGATDSHDGATDSHDGVTDTAGHRHPPIAGRITWRSLFVLGLAGGLIPSTSALLILLGSIAAGRPAFGFVLVVAFGFGMAAVMSGVGLATVVARDRLDGLPSGVGLGRLRESVALVAAVLVFGFGLVLTAQALGGPLTL
jgi:ABC-type nickel/cobalt efflux system permease component RcnA